jgi:hypothetical protein
MKDAKDELEEGIRYFKEIPEGIRSPDEAGKRFRPLKGEELISGVQS